MPSKVRITQRTIKQFLNANDLNRLHFILLSSLVQPIHFDLLMKYLLNGLYAYLTFPLEIWLLLSRHSLNASCILGSSSLT